MKKTLDYFLDSAQQADLSPPMIMPIKGNLKSFYKSIDNAI